MTETAQKNVPGRVSGHGEIKGLVRSHVALKNGNGTVALEDYDEKLHGKALEETDEQYVARLNSRPTGVLPGRIEPPTTIPHLQTVKPVVQSVPIVQPVRGPQENPQPVLTSADVERDKTLTDEGKKRVDEVLHKKQQMGDATAPVRSIPGVNAPANSVSEMGGSTQPPQPSKSDKEDKK